MSNLWFFCYWSIFITVYQVMGILVLTINFKFEIISVPTRTSAAVQGSVSKIKLILIYSF